MTIADLTELGSLLADRSRASMLVALMDGRALTVTELAQVSGIASSTASEHLCRLRETGLVSVEPRGRHHYFRLSGQDVASVLEALGSFEMPARSVVRLAPRTPAALAYARSCYDHLAGRIAVDLCDRLFEDAHLVRSEDSVTLTESGRTFLEDIGVDLAVVERSRRPSLRMCLDWTERRHHLAGGIGAGLFQALLERHWIVRGRRPRSITVTDQGRQALHDLLGSR